MAGSATDRASSIALRAALRVSGRLVEYRRSGSDPLRFRALIGQTWVDVIDGGEVVDQAEARTYRFPVVELAALDTELPAEGDTIDEADDDEAVTEYRYEAAAFGGRKCWCFADRDRKWIKVFTKRVAKT